MTGEDNTRFSPFKEFNTSVLTQSKNSQDRLKSDNRLNTTATINL